MRFISLAAMFGLAVPVTAVLMSPVFAETLELACKAPDASQAQRLTVDLSSGLVSSEVGGSGRHWAAIVTTTNISWDEIYDSRIGHTANHYVLDRTTDTLHRTEIARGPSGPDTLNAACEKAS